MDWLSALVLQLGLLVVFIFSGIPIVFGFFAVNIVGAWIFLGGVPGLELLVSNAVDSVQTFSLVPIPLFILMGEILYRSGVALKAIDAIDRLFTMVPGRLGLISIVSGTIFSALSGSSVANTAMLGSTLLPQMREKKYHPVVSVGPIVATGAIAALIPPSGIAILLGSLAEIPVTDLLLAGILPGLLMAALFFLYVIVRCAIDPSLAPTYEAGPLTLWQRIWPALVYVAPLSLLVFAVIGTMLLGIASPNEASAFGALGAFVVVAAYGKLSKQAVIVSFIETTKISGMILFIISASTSFSQILTFSGATQGLLNVVGGMNLQPLGLVLAIVLILLVLGCFVDQLSMMMITLPFFMPIALGLGINDVWLGVIILLMLEIGLLTPPFGIMLIVMKGVVPADVTMRDIVTSVIPYVVLSLVVVALTVAFPQIALWLPSLVQK